MFMSMLYTAWIAFLWIMTPVMILGNFLVIISVFMDKKLSRPRYHLLASLAVTDLIVGLIVMPIWLTIYKQPGDWYYGRIPCQLFVSTYITLAHASLNHLVVIAFDRYWSITDIKYIYKSTKRRIRLMIAFCWGSAALLPLIGYVVIDFEDLETRLKNDHHCFGRLTPKNSYLGIVFHAFFFYGLVATIVVLYVKIFMIAKAAVNRGKNLDMAGDLGVDLKKQDVKEENKGEQTGDKQLPGTDPNGSLSSSESREEKGESNGGPVCHPTDTGEEAKQEKCGKVKDRVVKQKMEKRREKEVKAAVTLSIITATFIVCCSPYYLVSTYFYSTAYFFNQKHDYVHNVYNNVYLLNLLNSACNPIIYTIFTREMREGFKRTLVKMLAVCGYKWADKPRRLAVKGSESSWTSITSSVRTWFSQRSSKVSQSVSTTVSDNYPV